MQEFRKRNVWGVLVHFTATFLHEEEQESTLEESDTVASLHDSVLLKTTSLQ
jgi:hypothetical protein